jgi:hypothetical protein
MTAYFTACQIARALGRSRQAVRQLLARVQPARQVVYQDNLADAWPLSDLPDRWLAELAVSAKELHFPDVEALLSGPAQRWQSPVHNTHVSDSFLDAATKHRAVFESFLQNKERDTRSQAELEAALVAAYKNVFGHAVSGRWCRELFAIFVERDRGFEDWTRLEIYLPRNIGPRQKRVRTVNSKFDHSALADRMVFKDRSKPTLTERQNALEYSFVHRENLLSALPGQDDEITRSIRDFMWSAAESIIARSKQALKRTWNRKFLEWKKNGRKPSSVADTRPAQSGNFCIGDFEPDLKLIVQEAWRLDGKLSIAIRKLHRAGKLSQTFIGRYTMDWRRNKSYVARSIRDEIKARLEGMLAFRRSQWEVSRHGPPIERDWTAVNPGDCFAADDCTFNIVWWYIDDHGRPAVTRGEVLLFFDCRSLYPLGYIMVAGHYNGETVRRGILHIHDRHGLPHCKFVFEKGIWESRLILGERREGFLGWDEYEMGLRENGLSAEVKNVTTPGAKLIEGVFNIVQQNQRDVPGFIGFNEREYGQERLQKFIGRVRRGLVHPSKEFLSIDQWRDALDRSLEVYMHEPQNGKLLRGESPAEMFARHQPLRKLPDDARFLLSTHRQRKKVRSNGVTITIRGQRRAFYNEALGAYLGRDVLAWFNIEAPDILTVTDLKMKIRSPSSGTWSLPLAAAKNSPKPCAPVAASCVRLKPASIKSAIQSANPSCVTM